MRTPIIRHWAILFFLAFATVAPAAIRTPEAASTIALKPFTGSSTASRKAPAAGEMKLRQTVLQADGTLPAFYIFEPTATRGFVVVSADDRTEDILCYSTEGTLDEQHMNPSMRWWLRRFQKQISQLPPDAPSQAPAANTYTPVAPLLGSIAWDQETPYNNQCPMSVYYPTERCLTGCVATASAQIMKYWEWPERPTGSHAYEYVEYRSYTSQTGRTCSEALNFDTITFDWANMRPTYGYSGSYTRAEGDAVATLMHACGVACDMQYGSNTSGGSGAWTDDMGYAFQTYFGYKPVTFAITASRSSYVSGKGPVANINCLWNLTQPQLLDSIYADLLAGRPVLMGGEDEQEGGHEFVCDGIDANGRLHINWGWAGECNCYTAINTMRPGNENYYFSDMLDVILHIEPSHITADTVWATGIEVTPETCSLDINQTAQLRATVLPENVTDKTLRWSSSAPSVASVTQDGRVTALSQGTAYIIATSTDGGFADTCICTVSERTCIFVSDTILASDLAADQPVYAAFSDLQKPSGAVYAGLTALSAYGSIQMRAYNANKATAAIYTTRSGGTLYSVEIDWDSHTGATSSLQIYGQDSPFADGNAVYATRPIGSIARHQTSHILGSTCEHLGLMSNGGVSLLNRIVITWQQTAPEPTTLQSEQAGAQACKIIRNGQVLILRDGRTYDLLGREIR